MRYCISEGDEMLSSEYRETVKVLDSKLRSRVLCPGSKMSINIQ